MAKYCVDGSHDEDVFELNLFWSYMDELLTQKRYLSYAINDAVQSLIFWRGQVMVGSVWLPVHSGNNHLGATLCFSLQLSSLLMCIYFLLY